MCETQLVLPLYLFGRGKLHLLYKIVLAGDALQLHKDCRIEFGYLANQTYDASTFKSWQDRGVVNMGTCVVGGLVIYTATMELAIQCSGCGVQMVKQWRCNDF